MRFSHVVSLLSTSVVLVTLSAAPTAARMLSREGDTLHIRLVLIEALPRGDAQEPGEPSVILIIFGG